MVLLRRLVPHHRQSRFGERLVLFPQDLAGRSTIVTSYPLALRRRAAAKPPKPEPITSAVGDVVMPTTLVLAESVFLTEK